MIVTRRMKEAMTPEQIAAVIERHAPLTADPLSWGPAPTDGEFVLCQRGRRFVLAVDGTLTHAGELVT